MCVVVEYFLHLCGQQTLAVSVLKFYKNYIEFLVVVHSKSVQMRMISYSSQIGLKLKDNFFKNMPVRIGNYDTQIRGLSIKWR